MKSLWNNTPSSLTKYLGWLGLSLFFLYQYFLRVAPGIMIENLRTEFHLSAQEFSTLGSYYLYAYALVQIPLGILLDRIGIKKTASLGLILTILGGLFMAYSKTLWNLQVSRILLGVGSGTAFLCAIKFVADSFKEGNRGLLMGGTLCSGLIGGIFAGSTLLIFIQAFGWRSTIIGCSFLGIALLGFIIIMVKDPAQKPHQDHSEEMDSTSSFSLWDLGAQFKEIVTHPMIMLYTILAVGVYTPLSVFADLWGTGFLIQHHKLIQTQAAFTSSSMYLGMGLGSFLLPWFCEKRKLLNQGIQICTLCILVGFAFIVFGPVLSYGVLLFSFISIGFFSGAEMMCFTGASLYTTPRNSGLTLGVVNTMNMSMGGILQEGVGKLLDHLWQGHVSEEGLRIYTAQNYSGALSLLLGVIMACCALSFFLKTPLVKNA